MKQELDFIAEQDYSDDVVVRCPAVSGAVCPQCGSGEVWQPMQTMDMPMYLSCLRCNLREPSEKFI